MALVDFGDGLSALLDALAVLGRLEAGSSLVLEFKPDSVLPSPDPPGSEAGVDAEEVKSRSSFPALVGVLVSNFSTLPNDPTGSGFELGGRLVGVLGSDVKLEPTGISPGMMEFPNFSLGLSALMDVLVGAVFGIVEAGSALVLEFNVGGVVVPSRRLVIGSFSSTFALELVFLVELGPDPNEAGGPKPGFALRLRSPLDSFGSELVSKDKRM